jgi:hypothetical protein
MSLREGREAFEILQKQSAASLNLFEVRMKDERQNLDQILGDIQEVQALSESEAAFHLNMYKCLQPKETNLISCACFRCGYKQSR